MANHQALTYSPQLALDQLATLPDVQPLNSTSLVINQDPSFRSLVEPVELLTGPPRQRHLRLPLVVGRWFGQNQPKLDTSHHRIIHRTGAQKFGRSLILNPIVNINQRCFRPKFFQIVELARFFAENVHHHFT